MPFGINRNELKTKRAKVYTSPHFVFQYHLLRV